MLLCKHEIYINYKAEHDMPHSMCQAIFHHCMVTSGELPWILPILQIKSRESSFSMSSELDSRTKEASMSLTPFPTMTLINKIQFG